MKSENLLKPRKMPSQERSKETVDIILKAAVQVFEQKGYLHTTTNHIADRAGVSIGTLYQYFPHKKSILYEMMKRRLQDINNLIEKHLNIVKQSSEFNIDTICYFMKALIRHHKEKAVHHRIIMDEVPEAKKYIEKWVKTVETNAIRLLENILLKIPTFKRENPKLAAIICVQTSNYLIHRYVLLEPETISENELIRELNHMVNGYLFAESMV